MSNRIKKFLVIAAIAIGISIIMVADGKAGEQVCGGEGQYDQTTGRCISR